MFHKVLYPVDVDAGERCHTALPQVLEQVELWGAELYLLYVLPGFGSPLVASYFPEGAQKAILERADRAMREFVRDHVPAGVPVTPIVTQGKPYEAIIGEAQRRGVDLIVIPSQDRGQIERWLLGSTASKVVHHAHCPVLVLREPAPTGAKRPSAKRPTGKRK